jgi:hypothetical protein
MNMHEHRHYSETVTKMTAENSATIAISANLVWGNYSRAPTAMVWVSVKKLLADWKNAWV